MKRIFSVARLTLTMLLRKGNGLWLLALMALVAVFFFVVCRADGILSHELEIRTRYGLTFAIGLFGVCLLWLACYSMRGDIEAKRLHMLTSYPLERRHIYLGKWLGLVGFGALGVATIMVTVGLCSLLFIAQWPNAQEVQAVKANNYRVLVETQPVPFDYDQAIDERVARLQEDGRLPERGDFSQVRKQLQETIRQDRQTLPSDGALTRQFDLEGRPAHGETMVIRYRFYSHQDEHPVDLAWTIRSATTSQEFEATTRDFPFSTNELEVPLSVVPADGRFEVTVTGLSNPELVIGERTGIKVYYRGGSLAGNCLKFFLGTVLHFSTIIAAGLTIGVAFTISVASFVAVVLYFLALTSSFFQGVLGEISRDAEAGAVDTFGTVMIRLGTFFTSGLEPPQVIAPLSEAMAITLDNLGMSMTRWFGGVLTYPVKLLNEGWYSALQGSGVNLVLGFLFYLLVAAGLGILLLTRKELDRVH